MNWWSVFKKILVVLLVLTIPFWIWDIDIYLESLFYKPELGGWYLRDRPLWHGMYVYGIFPGLIMAIISLFALSMSYWKESLVRFRKPALLLIFSLILGPGLVVNAILKDHYGRPRPGQIQEFGGTEEYHKVLVPGSGNGKSFPCGHGSIAFYMAIPFLIFRRKQKSLAYTFLIGGTLFGLLMSLARMLAGGHFASDVLWALGVVWLSAIAVAAFIKLDDPITKKPTKKQARRMTLLVGVLLPVLTLGVLLATPYQADKIIVLGEDQLVEVSHRVTMEIKKANLVVKEGESFSVTSSLTGFGFPNSRVLDHWNPGTSLYSFENAGFFTELNVVSEITVPQNLTLTLILKEGTIINEIQSERIDFQITDEVEILTKPAL